MLTRDLSSTTLVRILVRATVAGALMAAVGVVLYKIFGLTALAAVLFAIFLAQLLITIALSGGAYAISGLQSNEQALGRTASALNERLDTLGSSQNLQANALALGMVNSSQAAFLRLSDGSVLGTATAAGAAALPSTTQDASTDSVANSLLMTIPLIKSTGAGHGGTNAPVLKADNSESTQGSTSTASTGGIASAPPAPPADGDLPSPVTH